jgi:hypothetical protein
LSAADAVEAKVAKAATTTAKDFMVTVGTLVGFDTNRANYRMNSER